MTAERTDRGLATEAAAVLRAAWPALVVGAIVGIGYVALVPAGLPYDEPAHWMNVEFYLDHARMPELGEPHTSYEAQMGPMAYVVYAIVAAPFRLVGSDVAAFYASRALGIVMLAALATSMAVVAGRIIRARTGVATVVVTAAMLNPMLLAVATSIQNDILALLLGTVALAMALEPRASVSGRSVARAAVVGTLLALALLTKVTAWPFVVAIGVALLWRRRWRELAITATTTALLSAWWFVRNVVLYGDLTARAGVEAAGFEFPPLADSSALALAKSAVTYLWIPTEYVRNVVAAPAVIDAIVVGLCVIVAAGVVVLTRHLARPRLMAAAVLGIAAGSVAAWAVVALSAQAVAFRTAYPSLLLVYSALGALAWLGERRAVVALAAPLLVIDAWFLAAIVAVPQSVTWIAW